MVLLKRQQTVTCRLCFRENADIIERQRKTATDRSVVWMDNRGISQMICPLFHTFRHDAASAEGMIRNRKVEIFVLYIRKEQR